MGNDKKEAAAEEVVQIVTFRVGDEEYALDINAIVEVIRPLKITALPRMPKFVDGVINLRGEIIPVVDMRKRFEVAAIKSDPRTVRMMIIRDAVSAAGQPFRSRSRRLLGLIVDGVSEVRSISKRHIEAAPEAARGEQADFISGMGKVGDRLIIFLDTAKILSREERTALAEAGDGQF